MVSVKEFVDTEIKSNEIVMFSKSWCPFCSKAKKALDSIGADYKVIEIENNKGNNFSF